MTTQSTGGCLCGAIRYAFSGEPVFSLLCHCRDCQRQSGSGYIAAMRVPAASFRVTQGTPKLFRKPGDSGNEVNRAFCPDCGTTLYIRVTGAEVVGVRAATLDDPSGFRPEANIFCKSAQPWDHMDPDVPRYDTYPAGKAYPKPG
jgi:hypothetical protein